MARIFFILLRLFHYPMADRAAVASFLNYLQYERRCSKHTLTSYTTDLAQFEAYLTSQYEVIPESSNHGMIRSWLIELAEDGLDPSTINRKIACLRSFFKFLLREGLITRNPMVKVRVLKTPKRLPHFVRDPEMTRVLDHASTPENHAQWRERLILELLYGTGMRLSELTGLQERRVNFHDHTIKVLGKRNKERIIPFPKPLAEVIRSYTASRNKEIEMKDHGYLLVTDSGEPLYPSLVYRLVNRALKASSVEKKSPHVLRHTYATHLLDKGAEINAVKDLLGHSSLAATQVYTHNSMEKLKKVFEQAHPKA